MHLTNVLKVSKELGAKGIEGEAYLELGRLHMFKNQNPRHDKGCSHPLLSIAEFLAWSAPESKKGVTLSI